MSDDSGSAARELTELPVRDADGSSSVVGTTIVNTHRLLDAPAVRDLLTRSGPDHNFLAVVLSQRVFGDVVASEYATHLHGGLPAIGND